MNKYTKKMNAEGTNPPPQRASSRGGPLPARGLEASRAGGLRLEQEETQEWE